MILGTPPAGYEMVTGTWNVDAKMVSTPVNGGNRSLHLVNTAVATEVRQQAFTPVLEGDRLCLEAWVYASATTAGAVVLKIYAYDENQSLVWSNSLATQVTAANTWERIGTPFTPGAGIRYVKVSAAKSSSAVNVYFNELSLSLLPHGFSAFAGVAPTINNAAGTLVNFNSEDYDNGGVFSTATDRFTPKRPGIYTLSFSTAMDLTAGSQAYVWLKKNGVDWKFGSFISNVPAAGYYNFQVNVINQLTVGDYVECWAWQNTGGPITLLAGAQNTYFSASRIAL